MDTYVVIPKVCFPQQFLGVRMVTFVSQICASVYGSIFLVLIQTGGSYIWVMAINRRGEVLEYIEVYMV